MKERYSNQLIIDDFQRCLDPDDVFGEQTVLEGFGHTLDDELKEVAITLWYNGQTKPAGPDPKGWIRFQLVQPIMSGTVVRPYPDGYTVLAETERLKFETIVEHFAFCIPSKSSRIDYLKPLYVAVTGYRSSEVVNQPIWKGIEKVIITLNNRQSDGG